MKTMEELKLQMLRYQQATYIAQKRVVIIFEGFDAAGKGTCIRHLTETLDPRSCLVVPIGKPTPSEAGQHYLQRFWRHLPEAGNMVVFDRSWYGRVLVEKIENLAPDSRIKQAYHEINLFEKMMKDDGIIFVKIFLSVSKEEQLQRFKDRLEDPFKNWKITDEDVRNRRKWNAYTKASGVMFKKCPGWHIVDSNDKAEARLEVLKIVTKELEPLKAYFPKKLKQKRIDKLTRELFKN
jgi:polyphosphate kinase 2 (PPK2 family)